MQVQPQLTTDRWVCSHTLAYPSLTQQPGLRGPRGLPVCKSFVAALARGPSGLMCLFKAEESLCLYFKPFSGGPEQELPVHSNRDFWWIYQS